MILQTAARNLSPLARSPTPSLSLLQHGQRRTILGLADAIDRRVYRWAQSVLPPISKTENIALGCGTIGFDRDIFSGNPSLQHLVDTYTPRLSPEEQSYIDNQVHHLCTLLNDHDVVTNKDFSKAAWDYMRAAFWTMAVGKNKKLGKKKKGGRKIVDPFESKKEWYSVRAPSMFAERDAGYTVVSKTIGLKLSKDSLVGRVVEISQADLEKDKSASDDAFRKFKLKVEEIQGMNCLTNFYGMDLTTDKLRSLVRKWHTLIEAYVDVKTTDGYVLRLFCIGFTKRRNNQARKTTYAQSAQVRQIRKKMVEIMQREASLVDLAELVKSKLLTESFGRVIVKATRGIYPLQNVLIRKVKMIKAPKLDVGKLLELHGGGVSTADLDTGAAVDRPEE